MEDEEELEKGTEKDQSEGRERDECPESKESIFRRCKGETMLT